MVKSILNASIEYEENETLDEIDKNYEASQYKANLLDNKLIVALGKRHDNYIKKNIIFYYLYMIKKKKVFKRIGIYEIVADKEMDVLDDDGDMDLNKMGQPLLYSFVNEELFEEDDINFSKKKSNKKTKEKPEINWISETFKIQEGTAEDGSPLMIPDENYSIQKNEGRGDCLFAAIRDGLNGFKIQVDGESQSNELGVTELRNILINNVRKEQYKETKTLFKDLKKNFAKESKDIEKKLTEVQNKHTKLLQKDMTGINADKLSKLEETNVKLNTQLEELEANLEEYAFMEDVGSFKEYKLALKDRTFWGEDTSIQMLERKLNIKLIILSKETRNILCGQIDEEMHEKGEFIPTLYLLLNFTGDHYENVKYDEKGRLSFDEIPFAIKNAIIETCFKRDGKYIKSEKGAFQIIPDFVDYFNIIKGDSDEGDSDGSSIQVSSVNSDDITDEDEDEGEGEDDDNDSINKPE